MDVLRDSHLVIFSHSTTFNIFQQKSRRFSFQILAKFKAAKTASGVAFFLHLTAVCVHGASCPFSNFPDAEVKET